MTDWTAPRTWSDYEEVGEAILNTHIRDNLLHLYESMGSGELADWLDSVTLSTDGSMDIGSGTFTTLGAVTLNGNTIIGAGASFTCDSVTARISQGITGLTVTDSPTFAAITAGYAVLNGTADNPLNMAGTTVNSGGADILLTNNAKIDNTINGTLKLLTTTTGYLSISEGNTIIKGDYLDLDLDVALRFIGAGTNVDGALTFRDTITMGRNGAPVNLLLHGGTDLIVSSDGGSTEVARIDGATGAITTSSTVDGIDISAHDVATTAVHGAGAYTLLHTGDVDDIPVDAATTSPVSSNWAFDLGVTTKEPTGFPNTTDTSAPTLSSYTVTLAKTDSSFDFYIKGVKYTKSANQTVALPTGDSTDTGTWYIAFNAAGTLTATKTTSWNISAADSCPVAVLYFNGTAGRICDERHGTVMDAATHDMLHYTVGTRYQSGLTGTFTDTANIAVALGIIHDEDLENSIDAQTQCIPFYHASGVYTFAAAQNSYVVEVEGVLQYDNLTDLAPVTNNQYVAYWIFATMDTITPIWVMPGQRDDNLLKNARNLNKYESLSLGTLPFPEMKLLYRVIVKRSGTDEVYTETLDLRTVSNLPSGTYVATAHAALTGLLDDDHTQYFLLAGETTDAKLYSGADLIVYSDAGSTEVARIDGATGNITTSGTVDGVDVLAHSTANTGVHGIGASTFATASTLATHAALITGVHGLVITAGKTWTLTNSLTLSGTDASTLNIGTGGTLGTAAYTATGAYEASGAIASHAGDVDAHVNGASAGQLLVASAATVAAWQSTGVTLTSPVINGTVTTTGLTIPAIIASGIISMADGTAINTGVVDDDYFTIGAVDNDPNTITECMRFVGAATPHITIGAPTAYKVKFDPAASAIIFGDGADSWDVALAWDGVNNLAVWDAAVSSYRDLKVRGLIISTGDIDFQATALSISAPGVNDRYTMIKAWDTDNALVEVARFAGAANPYVSFGGSQQNLFYYDGTVTLGGAVTLGSTLALGGKLTGGANEIEGSSFDINGGTIASVTLDGAIAGGDQSFTNVGDMTFAAGSILKSGSTNTNTLLIAANDTTFITLTTGDTDTMALGVHTSGTINGLTLTASTGIFTLADGKTFTVSNTLTLTATDTATLAIGGGGTLGTAAYTATGAYEASGAVSTHAGLTATHGVTGAIVGTTDTQELTNKTITSPAINGSITTTGLTIPAFTAGGAITSASLEIKPDATGYGIKIENNAIVIGDSADSWDLSISWRDVNTLQIMNAAQNAYRKLTVDDLYVAGSILFSTDAESIASPGVNTRYTKLTAFKAAQEEVARIQGSATDPWFGLGVNGAVLKATNSGLLGFFAATPVAQQTGCAVPTDLNSCIASITALRTAVNNLGLTTVV